MTSAFSVLTCAILTWICMLTDTTKSTVYSEVPAPNWQSVGIGFGILAFQFGCHPAILTIQTDMNNKTQLSQSVLFSFFSEFFFHPFVNCISEDFFNYHKVVKDSILTMKIRIFPTKNSISTVFFIILEHTITSTLHLKFIRLGK